MPEEADEPIKILVAIPLDRLEILTKTIAMITAALVMQNVLKQRARERRKDNARKYFTCYKPMALYRGKEVEREY